jgi:hypothetical protein
MEKTEKTRLKGGSLSGTYLCRTPGAEPWVRKDVSLIHNREYGFQRWYSQLKRMQRYAVLFPEVFPKLLTYGRDGDLAYFDMEYIPEAVTAHEFLCSTTDKAQIDRFLKELIVTMNKMHKFELKSTAAPIELYIHEEIELRIAACLTNARFRDFIESGKVRFNGEEVLGLVSQVGEFKKMAVEAYRNTTETFTHGNLTLENILYQPKSGRVVFIDPYEENVIDSVLAEYSQLFQSSSSKYEIYNAGTPTISGNGVELRIPKNEGLEYFDTEFKKFLARGHDRYDLTMIRLLEVSQYARMLPFKMAIDEPKMFFFYALGSHLFHTLRAEWSR